MHRLRRFWTLPTGVLAVVLVVVTMMHVDQARKLAFTQAELNAVKSALSLATTQVGYRDPTYSELMQFLTEDKTNAHPYVADTYDCRNFVADLNLAAESQGFRAAFVSIKLRDGSHAVSAFNTVDRGMVYIEPQFDKPVTLDVGASYSGSNGFQLATSKDDTIERVTVIW